MKQIPTERWQAAARARRRQAAAILGALTAFWLTLSAMAAMLELDEYLERAAASRKRGDWQSVASQLAQALNHPHLPSSGMERSNIHLEYGRALGVLCRYGEAEKYLLLARDIARASGGSTAAALSELAAVNKVQGRADAAENYRLQAVSAGAGADSSTPYGTRCAGG